MSDYETALSLDDNDLSTCLKVVDLLIFREELEQAQNALARAAGKLGSTEEILEREKDIQKQKDLRLFQLLISNAWDTSWQTDDYHLFFQDSQGIRLNGSIGISFISKDFSYTLENGIVAITMDGYTNEWTFDEATGHFVNQVEEYGYVAEQLIAPIPLQTFFANLATTSVNEVTGNSYWNDLLDLIILCRKKSGDESAVAALQKEQEEWEENLNQEISLNSVDTTTRSGSAWKNYHIKNRIFELLGLPIDDSDPPVYKPLLTKDEALQIARNYWNVSPGDVDEYTGYELFVAYQDTIETRAGTYYCFSFYWMVTEGYLHPSTLDVVYINAETGACQSESP